MQIKSLIVIPFALLLLCSNNAHSMNKNIQTAIDQAAINIVKAKKENKQINPKDIELYTQNITRFNPKTRTQVDLILDELSQKLATEISNAVKSKQIDLQKVFVYEKIKTALKKSNKEAKPEEKTDAEKKDDKEVIEEINKTVKDVTKENEIIEKLKTDAEAAEKEIKNLDIFPLLSAAHKTEAEMIKIIYKDNLSKADEKIIETLDKLLKKINEEIKLKSSKPEGLSEKNRNYIRIFGLSNDDIIAGYINTKFLLSQYKDEAAKNPSDKIKTLIEKLEKIVSLHADVVYEKGLAEKLNKEIDKVNAEPEKSVINTTIPKTSTGQIVKKPGEKKDIKTVVKSDRNSLFDQIKAGKLKLRHVEDAEKKYVQ